LSIWICATRGRCGGHDFATTPTRRVGAILAGFGLIFTGIDYLQNGMKGIAWDLESFAGTGAAAPWALAAIGIVMTIVMQSSTAAAASLRGWRPHARGLAQCGVGSECDGESRSLPGHL
jgi:hypothetical protein